MRSDKMVELLSSDDLLKALHTLQHLGQSPREINDLSFGENSLSFNSYIHSRTKSTVSQLPRRKALPVYFNSNSHKSLTPPNRTTANKSVLLCSRPLQERSIHKNTTFKTQVEDVNKNKTQCKPIIKTERQAWKQSQRILAEKEKQGKSYVPLHLRAHEILKNRQNKIALREEQRIKELEEQEKLCTFYPKLHKRKIKKNENNIKENVLIKENEKEKNSETIRFKSFNEMEFLSEPTRPNLR